MAEKHYYIPGQNQSIYTASGNLQIDIFYPNTTAAAMDLDAPLLSISPIQYHLEVDPQKGTQRFGYVKLLLFNKNNVFETSGILSEANKNQTFCHIKLNGNPFFTGFLKWDKIRKFDWFLNNGTLQYRKIELVFTDVMEYAAQKTLADASYTEGIYFEDFFRNIASILYLNDGYMREDYIIQESRGSMYSLKMNTYDDGLRLAGLSGTMNLLDFLKLCSRAMGMFIFQQNGYLWLRQRNFTSPAVALDDNRLMNIAKIPHKKPVEYVSVQATKKWTDAYGSSVAIDDVTYSHGYGTQSAITSRNVTIDGTGILDALCVPVPTGGTEEVPGGTNYPTAVDTSQYEWLADSLYADFLNPTNWVESGMLLRVDKGGYQFFSITDALDDTLYFKNPSLFSFSTSNPYSVFRRKTTNGAFPNYDYLYKIYFSVQRSAAIYHAVYILRGERFKIQYKGLFNLADTILWNGKTLVIEKASYDVKKEISMLEAVEIL